MFSSVYTLVVTLLYLLILPFTPVLALRSKYRRSIPARFWLKGNPPFCEGGIWFHACSLGETRALAPLISRFDSDRVRLSVTTRTGYDAAESYGVQRRYLPVEPLLWFWVRPQKALVVMEAELWYLLFFLARRKGAVTFLINARISERSWPKYRRFSWLYRPLFARIDRVFAQSDDDARRLEELGARRVRVVGNLKHAHIPKADRKLPGKRAFLLCAASTHEGEEEAILDAFAALKELKGDASMAVVPRHPERFEKVASLMEAYARRYGWSFGRFSQSPSLDRDLVLVDRMGELVNCYAVSDLVILGGAFEPIGGHNAAEAAQFGIPIVTGPHYFHQKELFEGIEGITVTDKETLSEVIRAADRLPPTRLKSAAGMLELIEKEIRDVL